MSKTENEPTLEEYMKLLERRAEIFLNENEVPDRILIREHRDLFALFAKGELARQAKTITRLEAATEVLIAHRAVGNQEQDVANGKLSGYCLVCQVPWPCQFAIAHQSPSATEAAESIKPPTVDTKPDNVDAVTRSTEMANENLVEAWAFPPDTIENRLFLMDCYEPMVELMESFAEQRIAAARPEIAGRFNREDLTKGIMNWHGSHDDPTEAMLLTPEEIVDFIMQLQLSTEDK